MKQLLKLILGITIIFLFQHNALGAETYRIAVVDHLSCIHESNEGKRIYQTLKVKHQSMQKDLDEKQNKLVELKKDLDKQSMMLSLDAKEDKQKDFERKRRDLGYLIQDMNKEMNKAEAAAQKRIIIDLEEIVENIAREEKYDIVLEKKSLAVWFTSDRIDITDKVIEEYNKVKP